MESYHSSTISGLAESCPPLLYTLLCHPLKRFACVLAAAGVSANIVHTCRFCFIECILKVLPSSLSPDQSSRDVHHLFLRYALNWEKSILLFFLKQHGSVIHPCFPSIPFLFWCWLRSLKIKLIIEKLVCFPDNKAALLVVLTAQIGVVQDAIEEIDQVNTRTLCDLI